MIKTVNDHPSQPQILNRLCPSGVTFIRKMRLLVSLTTAFLLIASGCSHRPESGAANLAAPGPSETASHEGQQIVERLRQASKMGNQVVKVIANIKESGGESKNIHMTIYRKFEPAGRQQMLFQFNAPAEERDRAAIVTIGPQGDLEGTRYAQSNNSFVSTTSVVGEDSLFGMSLQELADGQPEKYEPRLLGEETLNGQAVYRVEGKLKPRAESKFPRLLMLISKENNQLLAAEFYDTKNELARRLEIQEAAVIDGCWMRKKWTVDNRTRQKLIRFETVSAKCNQKLEEALFSKEHLKQIASK